ncbi:MAG: PKD domain-containing protein [Bacteroidia bacterium]|nr:PKD domain-containing protein [Bacteroidia bacterium]
MKKIGILLAILALALPVLAQDTIKAEFSVLDICNKQESVFTNTSKIPPKFGACNYLWKFGDGTTSTDQFPSHTYTLDDETEAQVFQVTLIVQSKAIPTEIDSTHGSTTVFPNPSAYFTWDVINKGNTQDVVIDSQTTKDVTFFYQWTLANVLKSNDITPTFEHNDVKSYLDGSDHNFTLYVRSDKACEETYTTTFNYNPLSVDELVTFKLMAFPNPSTGSLHFDEAMDEVRISNSVGTEVHQESGIITDLELELPAGLYFLDGMKDSKRYTQRLVIK